MSKQFLCIGFSIALVLLAGHSLVPEENLAAKDTATAESRWPVFRGNVLSSGVAETTLPHAGRSEDGHLRLHRSLV